MLVWGVNVCSCLVSLLKTNCCQFVCVKKDIVTACVLSGITLICGFIYFFIAISYLCIYFHLCTVVQNNEDKYFIMHNTLSLHIYNPGCWQETNSLAARNTLLWAAPQLNCRLHTSREPDNRTMAINPKTWSVTVICMIRTGLQHHAVC